MSIGRSRRWRMASLLAIAIVALSVSASWILVTRVGDDPVGDLHSRFVDRSNRFRIDIPRGWNISPANLEPTLGGRDHPWEIFAAATYPMRPGGTCAQYPVNAIEDLPPDGALLVIQEPRDGRHEEMTPRPKRFPPPSRGSDLAQCVSTRKEFEHHFFEFRDGNRGFYVYVAFGAQVTAARKTEAWSILDSFIPT